MEQGHGGAHRPAAAPTDSGQRGKQHTGTEGNPEPGSSTVSSLQASLLGAAEREAQVTRAPSTSQDAKIRAIQGGDRGELFAGGRGGGGGWDFVHVSLFPW